MSDEQLVGFQTSSSDWHARRARLILQQRAFKGTLKPTTHNQLLQLYTRTTNGNHKLKALWAMHVTKGLNETLLTDALADKDEYIRSWAIQLLCEDQRPSAPVLAKFTEMARMDPSPVVRLYLASAMQRVSKNAGWNIAAELVKHGEDAGDHNLPKMIWYGLEPLVAENPVRAMALISKSKIAMETEFAARRAVDANAIAAVVDAINLYPGQQLNLMIGMMNGLEGRTDVTPPANWKTVYAKLQKSGGKTARLAGDLSQLFGDTEAARVSLEILKNKNAPVEKRRKALQMLAAQQRKELLKELPALLNDAALRTSAIQAVAAYEDEAIGKSLLAKYNSFSAADKAEVVQTLSGRPRYGRLLASAIKDNSIPKRDIPANTARQLRRVVGSGFVEIWGPIDDVPMDQQAYAKYQSLVTDEAMSSANMQHGQALFQRTCGSCHKLNGQGGNIGPDLSGSNRGDLNYLLFNVLNPSGEIQDAYKLVVITTRDGRTYSGNIINENERQLRFRVPGQEPVVINKSSIQSREVTPVSMMPQGLFKTLTDKEVIDLVTYIRKVK
jgi:putative heme-binding domain-containing protein